MTSVNNALFLKGINTDAAKKAANAAYAAPLFRDAINLRKGGLLDTASIAATAAGAAATPAEILGKIQAVGGANSITTQVNTNKTGQALPDFNATADNPKGALAAAIQVALGRGVRELIAATITNNKLLPNNSIGANKPFLSLDATQVKEGDNDPVNFGIFVSDQDGTARAVCMMQQDGTKSQLITKDAATNKFLANPGKIITTAMYDGIDLTKEDAIVNLDGKPFGKLKQVGIPCAVY